MDDSDQGLVDREGLMEGGPVAMVEEAARKREVRLLKNREAARECRRKKKEYIKQSSKIIFKYILCTHIFTGGGHSFEKSRKKRASNAYKATHPSNCVAL